MAFLKYNRHGIIMLNKGEDSKLQLKNNRLKRMKVQGNFCSNKSLISQTCRKILIIFCPQPLTSKCQNFVLLQTLSVKNAKPVWDFHCYIKCFGRSHTLSFRNLIPLSVPHSAKDNPTHYSELIKYDCLQNNANHYLLLI